jgi:hypothetical protein
LFELNRLPIDLDEQTVAARQLVELVFTPPHMVATVTPEVRLYALARKIHAVWKSYFLQQLQGPEVTVFQKECCMGPGDVLFIPAVKLLAIFRAVVEPADFDQLLELTELGAQYRAKLVNAKQNVPPHLKHLSEPTNEEFMQQLMREHDLSAQDVRDWLGLRYVLRSYSWLVQRVGDKANGPGQLIFLIREKQRSFINYTADADAPKSGSEFVGSLGIVPLRTTQIAEELGDNWSFGFVAAKSIHVPLKRVDFHALLDTGLVKRSVNDKHGDEISRSDLARGNFRKVTLRAI